MNPTWLWLVAYIFLGGLTVGFVIISIRAIKERMKLPPRPTYYVKHPNGTFTEADPQP
jgi:hypothetical protein